MDDQNQASEGRINDAHTAPASIYSPQKIEHTKAEKRDATKQEKPWHKLLLKAKPAKNINMSSEIPAVLEMRGSCWALIYKGDQFARLVPFIWQYDAGTRRPWAMFDWNEFYGKPTSFFRFKMPVLLIPFDKSPDMCDYSGRSILAKFDELTEIQISLHRKDTESDLKHRVEDRKYISENLQLYRDLMEFAKPKTNWKLIIIVIIIMALVALFVWYYFTHPNFLQGISGFFGHFGIQG